MHFAAGATGRNLPCGSVNGVALPCAAFLLLVAILEPAWPAQTAENAPVASQSAERADRPGEAAVPPAIEPGGTDPEAGDITPYPSGESQQQLPDLQRRLAAAHRAMEAGHVDRPEGASAWDFYRQIARIYPGNEEARLGLLAVQRVLLERAVAHAEEGDFDSAEETLEDARKVSDDPAAVDEARGAITRLKGSRAGALETQAMQLMDAGDFGSAERVLVDLVALGGQEVILKRLRQRLEAVRDYGGFRPGQIIRDRFTHSDLWTPESVVIPAGSYLMGSPPGEQGRVENEEPRHRVIFRRGFAIGRREVSVADYRAFVSTSGFRTTAERSGGSTVYEAASGRLLEKGGVRWEMNYAGQLAAENEPVLHVSWEDAQAYVTWLAAGTGKPYRLASEAEFEYALRAGTSTRFWWGNASPASVVENLTGELDKSGSRLIWKFAFAGYTDGFWGPAPVASFEPNPFGLFDMGGNVSEWVSDCWHDTYVRAPLDGSAWINPGCELRVIRGGYWASLPDQTRSAYRRFATSDYHDARVGFRIARDL